MRIRKNEYLELLDFNSQMAYKNAVNKILYDNIYDLELEYKLINGKTVKEHLFKSIDNIIISYFRDISIEKKKEDKLKEFAYSDNFTRVLSYKAFKSESADLLSNHDKSLILIDSDNFSLYSNLYGYEFVNQIIYSIGSFFKNNESDKYVTYHLDNSRFIILYNNNDKRSVKKSI